MGASRKKNAMSATRGTREEVLTRILAPEDDSFLSSTSGPACLVPLRYVFSVEADSRFAVAAWMKGSSRAFWQLFAVQTVFVSDQLASGVDRVRRHQKLERDNIPLDRPISQNLNEIT